VPQAVLAAAVNNTATYYPDVAVPPRAIEIMNDTKLINLTSRLGASQGVVVITVNVTGLYGLPVNLAVLPFLDGVPLPQNTSGVKGIALMHLKIFRPPGRYNLSFLIAGAPYIPAAVIPVQVLECAVGDVIASSGDACITCVRGSFSMDPRNTTCDPCPPNAGEQQHAVGYAAG